MWVPSRVDRLESSHDFFILFYSYHNGKNFICAHNDIPLHMNNVNLEIISISQSFISGRSLFYTAYIYLCWA